ncbi:hypothetical protein SCHPADRAFT_882928 [Schizopora paradoxa]|uniref:Glycerophosphocholine acyltransferase 1 n=1 Tax=Schizopora paradoxa TaxID=27342 RepID=A0A0H2R4S8_9AGAM|nr:hypothetical protein SCHPADRAFT_882928 [Schizopora paradoxa]
MSSDTSHELSRPPSPQSRPATPSLTSRNSSNGMGFFSLPFERFRDETEWTGALTLLDTIETFFDSRMDLLERQLKKHSDKLKMRAEETFKIKSNSGEIFTTKDIEKELQKFKLKVSTRMAKVNAAWHSAKVVRTREKVSFFFGVMSLLATSLLFGLAPEWLHVAYTVQALYLLPLRAYQYKKRAWHYFLFDLCYYATILNFVFLWIAPSSSTLWIACYCLSHGSLASAVITWRNSLVFHDSDKVTSLFVHIYAPLVFTVIRHFYPNAEERFPALAEVPDLEPVKTLLLSGLIYVIWQGLYWKFVLVDRRKKIESGERTTSFSWLLNDKRGVIGRMLGKVPQQFRELSFMIGQLIYGIITELPVFVLYKSPFWSGVFLILIFSVSVWNGGGFYIEVFGRKFERQLEALRKELAEATASRSGVATPSEPADPLHTRSQSDDNISIISVDSPILLPKELAPALDLTNSLMPPTDVTDPAEKKEQ